VTDSELWQEWVAQNETATVTYVTSDPRTLDAADHAPTEDEARAYFQTNRSDYTIPERVVLDYVAFSREPTAEDEADVRMRLTELAESARQGEDFAELASIYSDGPTRTEGGDLGWFGRGAMVPEFEEVAFSLDEGEISDPFETQYGYHIVKVEDTRTQDGEPQVKARHILIEVQPSEETLVAVEQEVSEFSELAADDGLTDAAAEMGYEIQTTSPFADGRTIPGIGTLRPAVKMAFDSDEETVLGPYVTPGAYYVFEVKEKLDSRIPSYDELAEDAQERGGQNPVIRDLTRERTAQHAREIAESVASAVRSGNTLEEAAAQAGLTVREAGPFTRRDPVPGVGRRNAFVGTAFGLRTGETSGAIEVTDPRRFYVLRVEEKTAAAQQAFEEQKEQLRQQLMQMERMELFAAWLEGLRDKADIDDYRDMYF
jgi:peptidyl-prolyl cis-trans isomerase D